MASVPSKLSDSPTDLRARVDGLALPLGGLGIGLLIAAVCFLMVRSWLVIPAGLGATWAGYAFNRFGPAQNGADLGPL